MTERFPNLPDGSAEKKNIAIRIFGRRFYKDQTPVEYLAEFLLVFASAKNREGGLRHQFPEAAPGAAELEYWPQDRLPLKFFSFFASSKLETRHPVHSAAYRDAVDRLKKRIGSGSEQKRDLTVRLLQSLFSGFVGVAQNRTWATQTFLPASDCLLAREVDWRHTAALGEKNPTEWGDISKHFELNTHNFMARGGEQIYLQMLNVFSDFASDSVNSIRNDVDDSYRHLGDDSKWKDSLESHLKSILEKVENHIGGLASFVEEAWGDFCNKGEPKPGTLGWVPKSSAAEAYLLVSEMLNVVSSSHGSLQKVEFLQDLCCLHVLRTLCFQSRRWTDVREETPGFVGNYAWIACARDGEPAAQGRTLAVEGHFKVEEMLFRSVRMEPDATEKAAADADEHILKLFRKLGKEIGVLVPRTGRNIRFVLPNSVIRLLVAALIAPGDRIRLSEFYRRLFAHYGIAICSGELATAVKWVGKPNSDVATAQDSSWFEDELRRGGFLIVLSDAVSIVVNPYK